MTCPKCGAVQGADDAACKKCGLAADRFESFATARDAAVPDALAAAWDRAIDSWEDTARHDEVLRLVAQHDAYAWAAARYRTKPDAIGERQLERVRKAAEATMMASAAARKAAAAHKPYRALTAMLVMLVIALVAGLVYVMALRDRATNAPTTVAPTEN